MALLPTSRQPPSPDAYEQLRLEQEKLRHELELLKAQLKFITQQLQRYDLTRRPVATPGRPEQTVLSDEVRTLLELLPAVFTTDDLISTAESLGMGVFKAYYELQTLISQQYVASDGEQFQKQ